MAAFKYYVIFILINSIYTCVNCNLRNFGSFQSRSCQTGLKGRLPLGHPLGKTSGIGHRGHSGRCEIVVCGAKVLDSFDGGGGGGAAAANSRSLSRVSLRTLPWFQILPCKVNFGRKHAIVLVASTTSIIPRCQTIFRTHLIYQLTLA